MFSHNKWRHDLVDHVSRFFIFFLFSLAVGFLLDNPFELSTYIIMLVSFSVVSISSILMKEPYDYQLSMTDSIITGASSYGLFRKISTIDLSQPFALTKRSQWFSIIDEYRIQQEDKTIYFSNLGLGEKDIDRLLAALEAYPHVKLY